MKTHEFTVVASGLDPEAEDFEERFYEAELYRLKGELLLQQASQKAKGKS